MCKKLATVCSLHYLGLLQIVIENRVQIRKLTILLKDLEDVKSNHCQFVSGDRRAPKAGGWEGHLGSQNRG